MQEPRETAEYVDFEGNLTSKGTIRKGFESFFFGPYFIVACLVLVGIISFCLGYYAKSTSSSGSVEFLGVTSRSKPTVGQGSDPEGAQQATVLESKANLSGTRANPAGAQANPSDAYIVASKNGTKYHYPWCSGAKQISDKNKITFNSIEEARKAGYTPASNCKGLK